MSKNKIVDVYFEYRKGNHTTLIGTSGNPGYTVLSQYWIVMKLHNGKEARINLKSDFKDLFGDKKITKEKREKLKRLIDEKKGMLIGVNVDTEKKEYTYAIEKHWQKGSQNYEKNFYVGLDSNSLKKIRRILEDSIREILKKRKYLG